MEDRQARILGEQGVEFGEGAEVETRAAVGLQFTGVAAIKAEAYVGLDHARLLGAGLFRVVFAAFRHTQRILQTNPSMYQPDRRKWGRHLPGGSAQMAHLYARSYCTAMVQVLL